jgi:hypothetical protein
MKSHTLKVFILITGILVFSSCGKDYLEVKPQGTELEQNFYQNADDALEGLIAVYDQVGGVSGGYVNKFTVMRSKG